MTALGPRPRGEGRGPSRTRRAVAQRLPLPRITSAGLDLQFSWLAARMLTYPLTRMKVGLEW